MKHPVKRTFGQGLIEAAREALAIARGEADPSTYRVSVPKDGRMVLIEDCRVVRTGRVLSNGSGR